MSLLVSGCWVVVWTVVVVDVEMSVISDDDVADTPTDDLARMSLLVGEAIVVALALEEISVSINCKKEWENLRMLHRY